MQQISRLVADYSYVRKLDCF